MTVESMPKFTPAAAKRDGVPLPIILFVTAVPVNPSANAVGRQMNGDSQTSIFRNGGP